MEKKITQEEAARYKRQAKQEIEAEKPDVAKTLASRVIADYPDAEAHNIRADAHLLGENYNAFFQDMNHPIHDIENTAAIPRSCKALLNRPLPLRADLSINGVSGMLLVIRHFLTPVR